MTLFFRIESLCSQCGKLIREIANGPYFSFTGEFRLANNMLADGTPLSRYEPELCDECKEGGKVSNVDPMFAGLKAKCLRPGCGYEGAVSKFKMAPSPYHDMRCPECGTTHVDTSEIKAKLGDEYGYGKNNTLEDWPKNLSKGPELGD